MVNVAGSKVRVQKVVCTQVLGLVSSEFASFVQHSYYNITSMLVMFLLSVIPILMTV